MLRCVVFDVAILSEKCMMSIFCLSIRHSCILSILHRRILHTSLLQCCHAANVVTKEALKHYYVILSVSETCTDDELRIAYISLVKKFHPDSISGKASADKFAQVENAYRQLLVCALWLRSLKFCCAFAISASAYSV